MSHLVDHARRVAQSYLEASRPGRWQHVTVVTAAWLHDIGLAPDLRDTGFHPLDGARFLTS
jgi:HD superfamily phosphodiesterase